MSEQATEREAFRESLRQDRQRVALFTLRLVAANMTQIRAGLLKLDRGGGLSELARRLGEWSEGLVEAERTLRETTSSPASDPRQESLPL